MTTRKKTELFAIGQPLEMLPSSVLPTAEDILRKYGHILSENKGHRSSIETLVGCKQKTGSRSLTCTHTELGGCHASNPCLVAALINPWFRSGFPTISAISVRDKVCKLIKNYIHLKKQSRVLSSTSMNNRVTEFNNEVKKLFDIGVKNLEEAIKIDRFR